MKKESETIGGKLINHLSNDNNNCSLGLFDGKLSIIFALCFTPKSSRIYTEAIKSVEYSLNHLIEDYTTREPMIGLYTNNNKKVISPYLSNGTAGLLKVLVQATKFLKTKDYLLLIKEISYELLNISYTQNATYANGMLGIVEVLLDSVELFQDSILLKDVESFLKKIDDYIFYLEDGNYFSSSNFQNVGLDISEGICSYIIIQNRFDVIKKRMRQNEYIRIN